MRVTDYRPMTAGALVALVTIEMPSGMILHGCPLYLKDGRRWVKPPAARRTRPDGTTAYDDLITFVDRATADRWSAAVLAAVDAHQGGGAR